MNKECYSTCQNAVYGMCCANVIHDSIVYDNNKGWTTQEKLMNMKNHAIIYSDTDSIKGTGGENNDKQ